MDWGEGRTRTSEGNEGLGEGGEGCVGGVPGARVVSRVISGRSPRSQCVSRSRVRTSARRRVEIRPRCQSCYAAGEILPSLDYFFCFSFLSLSLSILNSFF